VKTKLIRLGFRWQSFAVFALFLVLVGILVSLCAEDPHYLERFGALIAAIGAILVVVQIRFDLAVEREFQQLLRQIDEGDQSVRSHVMDEVTERIKQQSKAKAHEEAKHSRTAAAVIVAAITACGELLHGWGEVLMCYIMHCTGASH
jgi:CHASE3 domain sensor protein